MTTRAATNLATAPRQWKWSIALALSRLVMIPPLAIMLRISTRFILDPTHAAASTGISLTTPEALTDTRVVGGLTLTLAALIATAIFSRRLLTMGHATIALMMASILAIRMFGFMKDGTTLDMGDQLVKTAGEVVFLVLNSIGLAIYTFRHKSELQK